MRIGFFLICQLDNWKERLVIHYKLMMRGEREKSGGGGPNIHPHMSMGVPLSSLVYKIYLHNFVYLQVLHRQQTHRNKL